MVRVRLRASLAAPFLLAAGLAGPALAENGSLGEPKMLIHGNYCGPGNNAPLPPVDALDAACARHDACTPTGALPSPACNLRLQRDAEAIARDPRQPEDLRALAGLVAATATLIPTGPAPVPAAVSAPVPRAYAPAPRRPEAPDAEAPEDPNDAGAE